MNRRQLFAALAAAAAMPGELWEPKRTIFLPPRGGWPDGDVLDRLNRVLHTPCMEGDANVGGYGLFWGPGYFVELCAGIAYDREGRRICVFDKPVVAKGGVVRVTL